MNAGGKSLQQKYIENLEAMAKKAGRPLGPLASQAKKRPLNYADLSPQVQWDIDKRLGILDWDGEWYT